MEATTSNSIQKNIEEMLPYRPSFVNRFMDWVKRLPIPYSLTYLVLFILHTLLNHIFGWLDGSTPAFTFNLLVPIFPLWLWGPLLIMTYLDATALDALSKFSLLLDISPESMQRLKYEFSTMPARGAIINSFILIVIYSIYTYLAYPVYVALGFGFWFGIVHTIIDGLIVFPIGGLLIYHSIRQLRLVHHTVKLVKQFDLFRLDPVYAFSVLTSRTGIAWICLATLTLLMSPLQVTYSIEIGPIVGAVLSLVAFALPLWIVHQRLVQEKNNLLAQLGQRVKSTLARLHHAVDENDLDDVPQLNSVLEGLNNERNILEKIRTWPWKTETLTGFLSVIVLPIVLFLIQIAIQKWLNL